MDNADAISFDEAELALLFEEAGLAHEPVAPDLERVEKVIERSLHEQAMKDTASFVFKGFPAVIAGFVAVATNSISDRDNDYRA